MSSLNSSRSSCLPDLALLAALLAAPSSAQVRDFTFDLSAPSEVVATIELAAPGADWAVRGREAPVAELRVDNGTPHHIIVTTGPNARRWPIFLGAVPAGRHTLSVRRSEALSAPGARLTILNANVRPADPARTEELATLHAPVLYARANTIGRFSDVPLLVYATTGLEGNTRWFEYTVIFSNEDGGTSTRGLMARWGRAADIEYVYRVWLDPSGAPSRALIQTRDHKDVPYQGSREGYHPLLVPVTDNNMVEPATPANSTAIRFQFAPLLADLSNGSRELVMDSNPFTYEAVAGELRREGKLRAYGAVEGEKISDPRNYLTVEYRATLKDAALQVMVLQKGQTAWLSSSAGIPGNFVERSGWARVAVELPPGASPSGILGLGFQCMVLIDPKAKTNPNRGECRIDGFGKIQLAGTVLRQPSAPIQSFVIPSGVMRVFSVQ